MRVECRSRGVQSNKVEPEESWVDLEMKFRLKREVWEAQKSGCERAHFLSFGSVGRGLGGANGASCSR